MTPWLRTVRATGLAGVLGVGALMSPCAAGVAHGAGFTASAGVVTGAMVTGPGKPGHVASRDLVSPSASVPVPDAGRAAGSGPGGRGDPDRPGLAEHLERPAGPGRPDGPRRPDGPGTRPSSAASASAHASRPEEDRPTSRPGSGAGHRSATPAPASPKPAPSASAPDGEPSRAGSRAGEGRQRPGRPDAGKAEENGTGGHADQEGVGSRGLPDRPGSPAAAVPTVATAPPATATAPRPEPTSAARTEGAAGPVLKVLPLGSGLVLVGLGLALAFVALRLRRNGA
ncbi:hypothetical protein ABTX99_26725 [Streptomyces flaveolus]|uniref:hypothetical protein n=1 Tax=Streptomyces flaveolus TaxID=67297 RepID=UPI0033178631